MKIVRLELKMDRRKYFAFVAVFFWFLLYSGSVDDVMCNVEDVRRI